MADNKTKKAKAKADYGEESGRSALGVARRSIWYILRLVIIITACVTLCFAALVEAMYISNIYIITTEGMEMRADCILGNRGVLELKEHFYEGWLQQDEELLNIGKYSAYRVDSYDYRPSIKKLRVYPWSTKATLEVLERVVNIQATPYNDDTTEPAPEWTDSRMEIELEKLEGRWYITKITVLETNPEAEPRPTPDYSQLETDIPHY
ncbi:MAG: hypothetical protein IK064_05930 [Clostridia bacterium]|nr:hypothetical protein [Clostridia bacterium]MBR6007150.1 hypothetical protein [Clostridia bacterium]